MKAIIILILVMVVIAVAIVPCADCLIVDQKVKVHKGNLKKKTGVKVTPAKHKVPQKKLVTPSIATPSIEPTTAPTFIPSLVPTAAPSAEPTLDPTASPSTVPTLGTTFAPCQDYSKWHLSAAGANCADTCTALDSTCNAQSLTCQDSIINETIVNYLAAQLSVSCPSFSMESLPVYGAALPMYRPSLSNCLIDAGGGSDCTTTSATNNRFCYCP